MHRMYRGNKEYHDKSSSIKDFIKFYKIPSKLARRLHESNQESWWQTNGVDMNNVMKGFPEGMQADICYHLNKSLLTKNPIFLNTSSGCLRMLSLKFKLIHLPPGETLIHQNDLLDGIYFVARGTLEIAKDCVVTAILTKQDVFGEDAKDIECKTRTFSCFGYRSKYSVRALSYCDLHKMSLTDLVSVFNMYPEFAFEFFKKFIVTFNISTSLETLKEECADNLKNSKLEKAKAIDNIPVNKAPKNALINLGKAAIPIFGADMPMLEPMTTHVVSSKSSSLISTSSFAQSLTWDNSDFHPFNAGLLERKFQKEHLKNIKGRVDKLQNQIVQFEDFVDKKMTTILKFIS